MLNAHATVLESPASSQAMTLEEAFEWCQRLAKSHYENFPVASFLIPRTKRRYVAAIYAFARIADDFADEGYGPDSGLSPSDRLESLDEWEAQLVECYQGRATHPVFIALSCTVRDLSIPVELLSDLISAFKQDVVKHTYSNFDELLDYCRRSANPVGRLVLRVFGYDDSELDRLSDSICTALQLTNFWQDIAVDAQKNRIYLPQDDLARFGVSTTDVSQLCFSEAFRSLVKFEVERTREFFYTGAKLPELVHGRLRYELRLTWNGGMKVLEKIEQTGFNTLKLRPQLVSSDKLRIAMRSLSPSWPVVIRFDKR